MATVKGPLSDEAFFRLVGQYVIDAQQSKPFYKVTEYVGEVAVLTDLSKLLRLPIVDDPSDGNYLYTIDPHTLNGWAALRGMPPPLKPEWFTENWRAMTDELHDASTKFMASSLLKGDVTNKSPPGTMLFAIADRLQQLECRNVDELIDRASVIERFSDPTRYGANELGKSDDLDDHIEFFRRLASTTPSRANPKVRARLPEVLRRLNQLDAERGGHARVAQVLAGTHSLVALEKARAASKAERERQAAGLEEEDPPPPAPDADDEDPPPAPDADDEDEDPPPPTDDDEEDPPPPPEEEEAPHR